MPAPIALVEQLTLALQTNSALVGKALGERISRLFYSDLQRILAEELAPFAAAGSSLRLPRLVLELEPLAASQLERELPERLRAALRKALAAVLLPAGGAPGASAAPLATLRYFLVSGRLPWAARAPDFDLDAVVLQALRAQRGALRDLLRQVGGQALARQRLVRQLTPETLARLLTFLEPGRAAVVLAFVHAVAARQSRRPLVPASESALRYAVLEQVVASLASTQYSLLDSLAFVEQQLRQMAARYGLGYAAVVQWQEQGLASGPVAASAAAFSSIIRALQQQSAPVEPGELAKLPAPPSYLLGAAEENTALAVTHPGPAQPTSPVLRPIAAVVAPGRRLRPRPAAFRPGGHFSLATPATASEARELVFSYLLSGEAGGASGAWLRANLRRAATRQPAAVAGFLRRYGSQSGVLARLVQVADFATLERLPGRARPTHRPSLAALDAWATSPAGGGRMPTFLKALFVAFHYPTTGRLSGGAIRQLAATHYLAWDATLAQLAALGSHWPALAAAPFFRRIWPLLFSGQASVKRPDRQPAPARLFEPSVARLQPEESAPAQLDLVFRYLLQAPADVSSQSLTRLRQVFQQAIRQPGSLRHFLRQHAGHTTVQHRLARLADFGSLHLLVAVPGAGRRQRRQVRQALAALDRHLHQSTRPGSTRFGLLLREAYTAYALTAVAGQPATSAKVPADIRQRAAAMGLAWRSGLARMSGLLRQIPSLAADPFFRTLLQVVVEEPARHPRRPAGRAASKSASQLRLFPGPAQPAEAAWNILAQHLQSDNAPPTSPLVQAVAELLGAGSARQPERLRPYLALPVARARLAAVLTQKQFTGLLPALMPATYRLLAALLRDWQRLHQQRLVQTSTGSALLWAEVLAVAASPGASTGERAAALVQSLLRLEQAHLPPAQRPAPRRLVQAIAQRGLALRSPLAALLAALPGAVAQPLQRAAPRPAAPELRQAAFPKPPAAEQPLTEAVYITNAGLVLLYPFFTLLFERVGLLQEKAFQDPLAAERAAHLLQFLVTGGEDFPEYLLVLNKLLCGIERPQPLARVVPLRAEEKATAEGLLGAALGRWQALKNTSIAGLRETFLQRPGKLTWSPDKVTLTVETKTVDILLDQLPWSIALIKLPWMALPLYVTWR
ncbi:contractile injection system tape measure protein [Hymenobacter cheonanensis]|uniref:contractile injection system tape measure protein n=1 Tax=Hymenobacter sp. CA2-7 TaxID=3063993 RepID=UPI002712D18E|nr:contractile injection system tape measure protein [Hymenobacter sp. CA2-7]MDO7883975.1 contractile injection system tape measure protein [Hymenobacter sp. CA2-7]